MTDHVINWLSWAVPACFGLHVIEEFFWPGGFPEWYHDYRPRMAGASRTYYYKANAVYLAAALIVPLMREPAYAILIWSGVLFCNSVFTHVLGALKTRRYSPGIVTGCLLYVPLFATSYGYLLANHVVSVPNALLCVLVAPVPEIYFAMKRVKTARTRISEGNSVAKSGEGF